MHSELCSLKHVSQHFINVVLQQIGQSFDGTINVFSFLTQSIAIGRAWLFERKQLIFQTLSAVPSTRVKVFEAMAAWNETK